MVVHILKRFVVFREGGQEEGVRKTGAVQRYIHKKIIACRNQLDVVGICSAKPRRIGKFE